MVQWLGLHASTAGGTDSIPGCGTKIPHAMQYGQKEKTKNKKTLRAARFRPGPAGLPAGSQPHWRPPGAQQGPNPHPQRAESRPVQPRFTPPWLRSRRVSSRCGHLREHNWEALPYPRQEPTPALCRARRNQSRPWWRTDVSSLPRAYLTLAVRISEKGGELAYFLCGPCSGV